MVLSIGHPVNISLRKLVKFKALTVKILQSPKTVIVQSTEPVTRCIL